MKFSLNINQMAMREFGIRNINQAVVFDLLTTASTWAEPEIIGKDVFYWVARQSIVDELWILDLKPDTVYRHLKKLNEFGLIEYKKVGKKDCIRVTKKGKKYLLKKDDFTMSEMNPNYYVGNESEKGVKLGFKSEKNSDLNPTYHYTNINQDIKKYIKKEFEDFSDKKIDELAGFIGKLKNEIKDLEESLIIPIVEFLEYRKKIKKAVKTMAPLKSFVKELRAIEKAGFSVGDALELMQEREWRTIKFEWVKNTKASKNKESKSSTGAKRDAIDEYFDQLDAANNKQNFIDAEVVS